ncbi:MAG: cytochrome c biogenesis protein CcdA [Mycobacteriales bacterium]
MTETLGFAIGAGTLAALNPCGFAMLPAYLTLFVLGSPGSGTPNRLAAALRALAGTSAMTLGFLAVFVTFGLLLTPVASTVVRWLPVLTVLIGIALVGIGVFAIAGRPLVLTTPHIRRRFDPAEGLGSMALYGVAYAVASLGCTVGPFLSLTSTTFRDGDLVGGIAAYAAYAVGMGLVVGVLAVAIALGQDVVVRVFRRVLPHLARVGGVLLVVVGLYIAWYGVNELRLSAGGTPDDAVVAKAGRVQSVLNDWVSAAGPAVIAVALMCLIVVAAVAAWLASRSAQEPAKNR